MTQPPPVAHSWERIENWLEAHAPATFAALGPPASRTEIAGAEEALGLSFPEPLVESLRRHNGSDFHELIFMHWLLDTGELVSRWRMRTRSAERAGALIEPPPPGSHDPGGRSFHAGWDARCIPFATDGCGNHLIVDPTSFRRPCRIGEDDHEQGCHFGDHPMYRSLPALLAAVAGSLETGEALEHWEPVVDGQGVLEWEVV